MNPILLDLPIPILTYRLRLQPRYAGEGPVLNRAIVSALEHLKPWMPFAQHAPTLEESEEHCRRSWASFILRDDMTLSIYSRDGMTFMGSAGLHSPNWRVPSFHIGYWILPEFAGKGYVTEAANALTRYAFVVLNAKRVEIRCDAHNVKSFAVMTRLGFVQEGVLKNDNCELGSVRDTIVTARYGLSGLPDLEVSW